METKQEFLGRLDYLYEYLKDGLFADSYSIQNATSIEPKMWRKICNVGIIRNTGSSNKPHYTWIAKKPDTYMAHELLKDYPIFDADDLFQLKMDTKSLTSKDKVFDWVIPTNMGHQGVNSDFRINTKHGHLYIGRNFLQQARPDLVDTKFRVAFILNNATPHMVIEPNKGVPFYWFNGMPSKTGTKCSPKLSNKAIAKLFSDKFKSIHNIIDCKLIEGETINNMVFFRIIYP